MIACTRKTITAQIFRVWGVFAVISAVVLYLVSTSVSGCIFYHVCVSLFVMSVAGFIRIVCLFSEQMYLNNWMIKLLTQRCGKKGKWQNNKDLLSALILHINCVVCIP